MENIQPFQVIKIENIKRKIEYVINCLEEETHHLDEILKRLTEIDRVLYQKTIDAYSNQDSQRARVYADEIAIMRRMSIFAIYIKIVLEEVINRLKTSIAPTIKPELIFVLKVVGEALKKLSVDACEISPNIEHALYTVYLMVGEIEVEASNLIESVANEEVYKILSESSKMAERKMKEMYPELPAIQN